LELLLVGGKMRFLRMLKKDITYEDFNDQKVTETFYFNLTQSELTEFEASHKGGLEASIAKIVADEDGSAIIAEFKKLILMAIGQKSSDGRRFIKNDEIRQEFESCGAYDVLFMECVTDADKAAEFINGLIPKGLKDENQDELPQQNGDGTELLQDPPKVLSRQDLLVMDTDDIKSGLQTGRYTIAPIAEPTPSE
jgi:hypothetical protein